MLALGFSTFYLNRTNRSGIITGGMIGGKNQTGTWKIDARFHKDDLVRRVQRIGRWKSRIELYNIDASNFLTTIAPTLPARSLLYLDPPYYVKGQEMLYANYYGPADHADISSLVRHLNRHWVVSYDETREIRELYSGFRSIKYSIAYSANNPYKGQEVAFFSRRLAIPPVADPTHLRKSDEIF